MQHHDGHAARLQNKGRQLCHADHIVPAILRSGRQEEKTRCCGGSTAVKVVMGAISTEVGLKEQHKRGDLLVVSAESGKPGCRLGIL